MSIAYFPELYPDELIYSVLARFYEHSGYPAYIYCAGDVAMSLTAPCGREIICLNR